MYLLAYVTKPTYISLLQSPSIPKVIAGASTNRNCAGKEIPASGHVRPCFGADADPDQTDCAGSFGLLLPWSWPYRSRYQLGDIVAIYRDCSRSNSITDALRPIPVRQAVCQASQLWSRKLSGLRYSLNPQCDWRQKVALVFKRRQSLLRWNYRQEMHWRSTAKRTCVEKISAATSTTTLTTFSHCDSH